MQVPQLVETFKRDHLAQIRQRRRHLGEPGFHVLDCNWELMWRRGHVPGAVYVGFDTLPAELLPTDKSATLVFYCANAL